MTAMTTIALELEGSPLRTPEFSFVAPRVIDLNPLAQSLRLRAGRAVAARALATIRAMRSCVRTPWLTFIGSGDFHHLSLLLLESLPTPPRPITLVVIDNHPDWFVLPPRYHCGNWVAGALSLPFIERVILVGQDSADLRWHQLYTAPLRDLARGRLQIIPLKQSGVRVPFLRAPRDNAVWSRGRWGSQFRFDTVRALGAQPTFARIADQLHDKDVYLSIDKDCLAPADAATDWEQGGLRLPEVLDAIAQLRASARIIGADVCGDRAATPLHSRLKRLDAGRLRETWSAPTAEAIRINTVANLAILEAFSPRSAAPGRAATPLVRSNPQSAEHLAWTAPHG